MGRFHTAQEAGEDTQIGHTTRRAAEVSRVYMYVFWPAKTDTSETGNHLVGLAIIFTKQRLPIQILTNPENGSNMLLRRSLVL